MWLSDTGFFRFLPINFHIFQKPDLASWIWMDPDKKEQLAYIESEMVDKHNIDGVRPMFEFNFDNDEPSSGENKPNLEPNQEEGNHESGVHLDPMEHQGTGEDHHEQMEHEHGDHDDHGDHHDNHGDHHEHGNHDDHGDHHNHDGHHEHDEHHVHGNHHLEGKQHPLFI